MAFEEWCHWLEGTQHPFVVWMDHRNLEYLQQAKRLNPRQARGHFSSVALTSPCPIDLVPKMENLMPYPGSFCLTTRKKI
jgi:hypothetical protein